jgi:hypothetical protein
VRAGIYMLGDSTVGCPSGYTGIADSTACQSAAAAYISTSAVLSTCTMGMTCSTCTVLMAGCPSKCTALVGSNGAVSGVFFDSWSLLQGVTARPICIQGPPPFRSSDICTGTPTHAAVLRVCAATRACVAQARSRPCVCCGGAAAARRGKPSALCGTAATVGAVRYGHGQCVYARRAGTEYSRVLHGTTARYPLRADVV